MRKLYALLLLTMPGYECLAQFQYQGSYLNISRSNGGPVATGDILELRAVVSVPSGTSITRLNYIVNALPTGTSFVSGSLKVETNEGLVIPAIPNTGSYTDAAGDDAANITAGVISFFMGTGASPTLGGAVTGGVTQPLFQSNASIFMAVYRVQVTAATGSTVTINGSFHYRDASNVNNTKNLPAYNIFVSPAVGCNSSSTINLLSPDFNGTFGTGTVRNRASGTSSVTGYTFTALNASAPVDGQYSVVNNTSSTGYSGATPATSDKVFGVWDVVGDHTGSATGAGNPPAAAGSNKGYMLAVNASFAPAVVYNTSPITLSANTDYTLSFWLRNICGVCANNPATGVAMAGAGVKPNLSFDLNAVNYFSTGEVTYSGLWVKKSFTFNTGATTSFVFTIKNNAPGGGGNDWVLDDLTITQCLIVLPVSLIRFQGSLQPDGTLLSWETAGEEHTDAFYVERSTDGLRFLTLDRVAAKKTGTGNSYFYNDTNPPAGKTLYYRLRMTADNEAQAYSNIITFQAGAEAATGSSLLAPNPARGSTTLYIRAAAAGTARISLLNAAGRTVYTLNSPVSAGQNAVLLTLPGQLAPGYT